MELAAYLAAGVHVFLLPGQAKVAHLVELIEVNLTDMCTHTSSRNPGTWRLTMSGLVPLDITRSAKTAKCRTDR